MPPGTFTLTLLNVLDFFFPSGMFSRSLGLFIKVSERFIYYFLFFYLKEVLVVLMDTLFNFGDVYKDFEPIARDILGSFDTFRIPITNTPVFHNDRLQIVSSCYGAGLVRDALMGLKHLNKFKEGDVLIGLGSNGSLTKDIHLDELLLPLSFSCKYYGFKGNVLKPNKEVVDVLKSSLIELGNDVIHYRHGSVYAVFDEHTDHERYTNSLYSDIEAACIDCGESYILSEFARSNNLRSGVLLYCSDDPIKHISDLPREEFDERAVRFDKLINRLAFDSIVHLKDKK